ncbi:MAG: DUF2628 domain-containing protein [Gemmatimonadota bacterium]
MRVYEHPLNGYREEVTRWAMLWALLFGPLYFIAKGAYGLAFLIFLIAIVIAVPTAGVGPFIVHVIVVFATPSLLDRSYMRRGWRRVAIPGT